MKLNTFILSMLFLFFSISVNAAPPKATQSDYLQTIGGGFMISEGKPIYAMNYEIIKKLPDGYFMKASFQNPKKGQPPIVDTKKFEIEGNNILVQSPGLECIKNKRKYEAIIYIYASSNEEELISTHSQKIEFNMPKSMIKQLGVSLC